MPLKHFWEHTLGSGHATLALRAASCRRRSLQADKTVFHYHANVTPAAEYNHWDELIDKLAAHLVERYSASDLRDWFFEVWNDHPGFRLKCGAYWKCRPQRRVIIAPS